MKIDWNRKYTTVAVYAFLVLSATAAVTVLLLKFGTITAALGKFIEVITPVLWGFAIAYILNRPMKFFKRKVFSFLGTAEKPRRKLINGLSITSVYLIFIACIVALIAILVPQISRSITVFVENLPSYLTSLDIWLQQTAQALNAEELIEGGITLSNLFSKALSYLQTVIPDIANAGIDIATKVLSYASKGLLAIVISIYTLLSKDLLISQTKKAIYALFNKRYAENTIALTRESNDIFNAYISNVLLEALIIGGLHFLVLTICRIPYAPLISIIIGITDIIPYLGPVIGAAVSMLLLFVVSPAYALTLLIVTVCIQQLEAHLIAPKILGESTGLTKFWVVFAILLGGGLFGIPGTILGIPLFAVLYSVFRQFIHSRLKKRNLSIHSEDYSSEVDN